MMVAGRDHELGGACGLAVGFKLGGWHHLKHEHADPATLLETLYRQRQLAGRTELIGAICGDVDGCEAALASGQVLANGVFLLSALSPVASIAHTTALTHWIIVHEQPLWIAHAGCRPRSQTLVPR